MHKSFPWINPYTELFYVKYTEHYKINQLMCTLYVGLFFVCFVFKKMIGRNINERGGNPHLFSNVVKV